jgi:hypothetical protein
MNGFSATIGITNPNQGQFGDAATATAGTNTELSQDRFGVEGQVMYEWTGDVAGKVWASGATYDVEVGTTASGTANTSATVDGYTASVVDIGAAITAGNLGLVGYYYNGEGVGTTILGLNGTYNATAGSGIVKERDSDGGYVQATYVIPTGTKLGVSYGVSNLDEASGEVATTLVESNKRWTVGAYHPLTKHLNLVAEYNRADAEAQNGNDADSDTVSLGAILFF